MRNLVVLVDLEASAEVEWIAEERGWPERSRFKSHAQMIPSRPPE